MTISKNLTTHVMASALALCLGGWIHVEQTISFNPDGSATSETRVEIAEDVQDIVTFLEMAGRSQPESAATLFQNGLCGVPQRIFEVEGPPPEVKNDITLTSEPAGMAGKFACRLSITYRNPAFLVVIAAAELPPDSPLQVKILGERRVLFALDLSSIPTSQQEIEAGFAGGLRDGMVAPDQLPASQAGDAELWRAFQAATLNAARLLFRDGTFTLIVKAPQIVDSRGATEATPTQAVFRLSWTDWLTVALRTESWKDTTYSVVVDGVDIAGGRRKLEEMNKPQPVPAP